MVKRRIIGLFTLPILLLNSCNQQSLRSDIKQFIASFSLEESIKEYQEAGYDSFEIITVEGEGVERIEESISFNVKEDSPNYYHYLHKEYVNDELMIHKFIDIEEVNDKLIYHSDEIDSKEITTSDMSNIVIKFFSTSGIRRRSRGFKRRFTESSTSTISTFTGRISIWNPELSGGSWTPRIRSGSEWRRRVISPPFINSSTRCGRNSPESFRKTAPPAVAVSISKW